MNKGKPDAKCNDYFGLVSFPVDDFIVWLAPLRYECTLRGYRAAFRIVNL
jgi:hypothetical protein